MSHPLDSALEKVKWAKEHIVNLRENVLPSINKADYRTGVKEDTNKGKRLYYIKDVPAIPVTVSLVAGDVIQNIRSALDHLAYQLVYKDTSGKGVPRKSGRNPFRHVYYPISDGANEYEAEKPSKIKGMSQASADAIDATKPYKGGNDTLWQIDKLNNIDKHRLLLTVSLSFGFAADAEVLGISSYGFDGRLIIPGADFVFPANKGHIVFMEPLHVEPQHDRKFPFDVALAEPGVIEGKSIVETLQGMADLVNHLISDFAPLF